MHVTSQFLNPRIMRRPRLNSTHLGEPLFLRDVIEMAFS